MRPISARSSLWLPEFFRWCRHTHAGSRISTQRRKKTYEGTIKIWLRHRYLRCGKANPPQSRRQIHLRTEAKIENLAALAFVESSSRFRQRFRQKRKFMASPAYKLATHGQKEVVLQPVQVEIKEFVILNVGLDRVFFRARVASGPTCVPSLTKWKGTRLCAHSGVAASDSVAEFNLEDACTLDRTCRSGTIRRRTLKLWKTYSCIPADCCLNFPPSLPTSLTAARIRNGGTVNPA